MGTDPWPHLRAYHLDAHGMLVPAGHGTLPAQAAGRPVVIMVQGNLVCGMLAVNTTLKAWRWLDGAGAIPRDALVVLFDWPSGRALLDPARDLNEKSRRAFVAGYHLARLLQAFPAGSRVCLIGHSEGGRVVAAALHLLGGGVLNSQSLDPPIGLSGPRPPLRLRAAVLLTFGGLGRAVAGSGAVRWSGGPSSPDGAARTGRADGGPPRPARPIGVRPV